MSYWIEDFKGSIVFFWLSGNTSSNGKGCLMTYYYVSPDYTLKTWYAGFNREKYWKYIKGSGISQREIDYFLNQSETENIENNSKTANRNPK